MTRLRRWLAAILAPLRLFREQAELARRELDRQPRTMTAEIERRQGEKAAEVFRRNEGRDERRV